MEGQQPNFNIFSQPQSLAKPSSNRRTNAPSPKNETLNSSSTLVSSENSTFSHQSSLENSPIELPQGQFPTTQHPVIFYKIKERTTSESFTSRIGYRVREFSRIEQDYICYLTQILMTQCPWIKIFIIDPNFLYFQMNSLSTEKGCPDNTKQNEEQQIKLQNRIFNFLKFISQQVFSPFINSNLAPCRITSNDFQEELFILQFQKQVVKKTTLKYDQMFTRNGMKFNH